MLRTAFLSNIPSGITDDEVIYVLNAKAVFLTGSDISGTWNPLSLKPITSEFPMAELPYIFMAPFIGLAPLSLFWSKLPYAVLSSGIAVLLYLISLRLIGKPQAFIIGIVAAFNPWGVFFGRTAYDTPTAIFFYLLALYLLLVLKKWKILFAFIPLLIAFYSYIGTKLIFIPFSAITIFYAWYSVNNRKFTKYYIILGALCAALFFYFLTTLSSSSTGSRLSELSTIHNESVSNTVNAERRLTASTPLSTLFSNKAVVWGKELTNKYFKVFSPEFLFTNGESRSTFSLWYHGYFYYIDALFLLLGICFLFMYKRRVFLFLVVLAAIAPIPTLASNGSTGFAAIRSALLFPLLSIFVGCGIYFLLNISKKKWIQIIIGAAIIFVYALHILNFAHIYFYRYPVYTSEAYGLSYRVLSKYIELAYEKNIPVTVVANGPKIYLYHYIFDTNSYSSDTTDEIKEVLKIRNNYTFKNVTFTQCDTGLEIPADHTVFQQANIECPQIARQGNIYSVTQLSDSGKLFRIINDKLCSSYKLKLYPHNFQLKDFNVEQLSEEEFCKAFVINLD